MITATIQYARSVKSRAEINGLHKIFAKQKDLRENYRGLDGRRFVFEFSTRKEAVEFLTEMQKSFEKHGEKTVKTGNW